jgi:tetratricopeptide (TPR) repeat protein
MKSSSRFSHVFWIDASSEDTIALGLKSLRYHPEAKAAGVSVSAESALIWIGSLQSEWLLVFDSADGAPEVVEKFIPSGSLGNILVTSRNRSLGRVTSYENSLEIDQEKYEEAEGLELKVLDLHNKVLGPEHPSTLTRMVNLAETCSDQGKYEKAKELQLKELHLCEKMFGQEHPSTLISMENLVGIYSYQGKYEEAEELQLKVFYLLRKRLGPEHPNTLTRMNNLGVIYIHQGKYDKAEQLLM